MILQTRDLDLLCDSLVHGAVLKDSNGKIIKGVVNKNLLRETYKSGQPISILPSDTVDIYFWDSNTNQTNVTDKVNARLEKERELKNPTALIVDEGVFFTIIKKGESDE